MCPRTSAERSVVIAIAGFFQVIVIFEKKERFTVGILSHEIQNII